MGCIVMGGQDGHGAAEASIAKWSPLLNFERCLSYPKLIATNLAALVAKLSIPFYNKLWQPGLPGRSVFVQATDLCNSFHR